jgi:hypothetical protein
MSWELKWMLVKFLFTGVFLIISLGLVWKWREYLLRVLQNTLGRVGNKSRTAPIATAMLWDDTSSQNPSRVFGTLTQRSFTLPNRRGTLWPDLNSYLGKVYPLLSPEMQEASKTATEVKSEVDFCNDGYRLGFKMPDGNWITQVITRASLENFIPSND